MIARKSIALIDFDNTIVRSDVLDDIIERFSVDDRWVALEKAWKEGKIGSRQCLEGQLDSVRVTRRKLSDYLAKVKIDPSFKKLIRLFHARGIPSVIVSDSFSFIIKTVLEHNGVRGIRIFSNRMRFCKDRIVPLFPYTNARCGRCAHCKTSHLSNGKKRDKIVIYIGDGLSDACPAGHADIVFAKDYLLSYMQKEGKKCIAVKDLGDVLDHFIKER